MSPEQRRRAGRRGGYRRAINLSDKQLSEIARKGGNARWAGLTAEERKIEAQRYRPLKPRCPCGKWPIGTALYRKHKCEAPKDENAPAPRGKKEAA